MNRLTDQDYLRNEQYKDQSNLGSRIDLHSRYRTAPVDWPEWYFQHFDPPDDAAILEVGCGSGIIWSAYRDDFPDGWQLTLTDISRGMLGAARNALATKFVRPAFGILDAQHIPFPDNHFDAVLANFMLYHVPNLNRALHEIRRVLKPGGRMFAATVGEGHMLDLWELLQRFDSTIKTPNADWGSNHFTLESGQAELEAVFPDVTLLPFEDTLAVTNAAPLAAYATSMTHWKSQRVSDGEIVDALTAFFEQELAQRGRVIHIRKQVGLYIASTQD